MVTRKQRPASGQPGWGEKATFDFTANTDPEILNQIRSLDYEVVIVDTPGSLEGSDVLGAVIPKCDIVIIPTEPSSLGFEPLKNTIKLAAQCNVPARVVISRVDPRSAETDAAEIRELLDTAGIPYLERHIRAYKIHSRAPLEGKTVSDMGWGPTARRAKDDFQHLSRQLIGAVGAPVGEKG